MCYDLSLCKEAAIYNKDQMCENWNAQVQVALSNNECLLLCKECGIYRGDEQFVGGGGVT